MTVGVVGSGPALDEVTRALEDVDVSVRTGDVEIVEAVDLAVVAGLAGSGGFERANDLALAGETPWIALEVGGIGGVPIEDVDASIAALEPGVACFDCLRTRVRSVGAEAADEPSADRTAVRLAGAYAGQLAVRSIAGAAVAGTVIELPHVRRTLLGAPGCRCQVDGDGTIDRSDVDRSLEESITQAERAIDDRVGIVPHVGEHDSFPAPYYLATVADTTAFGDGDAPDRAAGVAEDWDHAFMKALGEALERYSAAIYREDDFERATVAAVDGISPARFVRPTDAPAVEDGDVLPWVEGVDIASGAEVALPAGFVHFPPPDDRGARTITTGLGLGNDWAEAVLSGLYEVVERDATMLSWYSTYEPMTLAVDDDRFSRLERRARSEGLSVTPLLMTQDVDVPVVATALTREEWPAFAVGSAADLDATAAARDSLAEAIQNWMELRDMDREEAAQAEGAIVRYADFPREVRDFADAAGTVPAADVGVEEPLSGTAELEVVLDRVGDVDLDAYAASVTPRDVAELGFEAVRVLVPEAQPLFVDEPFFGERAKTVPRDLGYEPRLDRPFHPYP
ncbi:MAG: YcaO-like family protein [Halanaeroarchaeum sp.]